jgi:hypothetical protein
MKQAFNSLINLDPSFYSLLNIKKYVVKGKIIYRRSIGSQIDFGHNKGFQISLIELESYFKSNPNTTIKNSSKFDNKKFNFIFKGLEQYRDPLLRNNISKKNVNKFFKKVEFIKSLRKYLFYKKIIIAQMVNPVRAGFKLRLLRKFPAFMPGSHSPKSKRAKNKMDLFKTLEKKGMPIKLLGVKCRILYKNFYNLNIVISYKKARTSIKFFIKFFNSKRIMQLIKLRKLG